MADSDYNPQTGDQYKAPYDAPAQRKGMSGCFKALIILLLVGVAGLAVCCVGGYFYIRSAVTTDPVKARAIANEIIAWDFNEEMEARFGLSFFLARVASLEDRDKGFIIIADSKYADAKDTGKRLDAQIRSQVNTGDDLVEDTELVTEGEREIVVKGETVLFQFNHTRGLRSGQEYWEVAGIVPGNDNPTFVMLKLLQSAYDEEAITRRLESIR